MCACNSSDVCDFHQVILALGDYMSVQCHACIGGTNVGEDIRKLDYGQHVVSGTPGRVFGMLYIYSFSSLTCLRCILFLLSALEVHVPVFHFLVVSKMFCYGRIVLRLELKIDLHVCCEVVNLQET